MLADGRNRAHVIAPDFVLADGRMLSSLRGNPVVLVLHNTEWNPARAELVSAYERIASSVLRQAIPGRAKVTDDGFVPQVVFEPSENCASDDGLRAIPVVVETSPEVSKRYDVSGKFAVLVLNDAGRIVWLHVQDANGIVSPDAVANTLRKLTTPVGEESSEHTGDVAVTLPPAPVEPDNRPGWNRREFVAAAIGVALVATFVPFSIPARAEALKQEDAFFANTNMSAITLRINGRDVPLSVDTRTTLLDALREHVGLTGSKKGCDHGQCGACTVHIGGRRVLSCLTLAVMATGKDITTIEGISGANAGTNAGNNADANAGTALHPMQQAFVEHDGFQCGYCTPGQIMSAVAVLKEPWGNSDADVREAMSGNICRCGAYPGIVAAVQSVRSNGRANTVTPSSR